MKARLLTVLAAAGIFCVNVWLNWPLFLPGELPFRGSVEGGYASMARFISAHPNPWGWNTLQYCGVPTQFLYVPALPYLTALAVRVLPIPPEHAFRLLTATGTCLGPVTLFAFAFYFTRSRRWAILAALAYSLVSPSYGLFPQVDKDRGIAQLPWRIQVLAKYGEGPHNMGLTLMPVALTALWIASRRRGFRSIFACATVLAAIPLTNWLSAFSLAIGCMLLLVAAWGDAEFRVWRAFAAAGLAYFLACFWLTPSFIQTIAFNWPVDSFGYHFRTTQMWLVLGLLGSVVAIRLLFRLLRGSFYFCLVTLCAVTFGWFATCFYVFGVDVIPESRRYALEFELFLALALGEALRLMMSGKDQTLRFCAMGAAGVMFLFALPQVWPYVTQDRDKWKPVPAASTVEYQLGAWLAQRHPEGRIFASGGLRFRLNSWFDLKQVGGGFETGLRNRAPVDLAYRVRSGMNLRPGREAEDIANPLRALGVQYVVVHGPKSKEYYRDYRHPEWLTAPIFTTVYDQNDDRIYELPVRPMARLIGAGEAGSKNEPDSPAHLEAYVASILDAKRPQLIVKRPNTNLIAIEGPVPEGMRIAVQENADPGWRAFQDGRPILAEADALGFLVVRPVAAATTRIELRYEGTTQQRVMALLCLLAWAGAIAAWFRA